MNEKNYNFKNNNINNKDSSIILNQNKISNQEEKSQYDDEASNSLKIRLDIIESENKKIKQQLSDFHDSFKEMERVKNNEINALNTHIKDLESRYEILKNTNKITEETNSKLTLENNTLMKENNSLKFDRDILTKNIKELTENEKNFETKKKKNSRNAK